MVSKRKPGTRPVDAGGEPKSPKAPVIVLGDDLEYRVCRLLMFMGYFVRRGCPIYTVAALDRATDLDVLAIRYLEPFRRDFVIAECKSGDIGPLDRIFWLSGVRNHVKATEAFLVRKGTKWNIKDFARKSGVQVLDLFRITELEHAYKATDSDWPGISDREYFKTELSLWNKTLVGEQRYWELYLTISAEIDYDEPFAGLNYLLSQLRQLTRQHFGYPGNSFYRHLISEALTQTAQFVITIVRDAFDLAEKDRGGFVKKGLVYGSIEPRYAERILSSAYNLTRQAVLHYTNQNVDIDRTLFEMPVPPGTNDVISLVEEVSAAYPVSLSMPQVCDVLLSEVFVKQNKTRGWVKRLFPVETKERVDVVRKFLRRLNSMGACPQYVIDAIAPVENGNRAIEEHNAAPYAPIYTPVAAQLPLSVEETPALPAEKSPTRSDEPSSGLDASTQRNGLHEKEKT